LRCTKALSFGDGLIAEEISDLRDDWMEHARRSAADEEIVAIVYERWRNGVPTAVAAAHRPSVLRLLTLSTSALEYEAWNARCAPSGVPDFTRVARQDARCKTMGQWGVALGRKVLSRFTSGS